MAIAVDIYEQIRYYHEHSSYSQRQVAKMLSISRNTVKKYWNGETVPWERKEGSGRKSDVMTPEVLSFITSCLEADKTAPRKQRHTAHRIYTRLVQECGFTGSEVSVRRIVASMRVNTHDVFVPLSYQPAEAIQVDWGEATVFLHGARQKIQIWCMRECSSNDIFVTTFYRQNEESFLEGIVQGLEYFGGTPQKVIFDNARIAVKEGFGSYAKATDRYRALSAHYAFQPVFCNPAQGHEKGLVEGLVGLARRNFFTPQPKADTIEALNAALLEYCQNYRKHKIPGKSMTVGEIADLCKGKWIPLPPFRYDTSNTIQIKADDFSLVKFDHNKYSVPYQFSRKTVTVKGTGNKVRIILNNQMIAEYDRDYRHDRTHYRLEHYIDLIERRPRSVYNAAPVKATVPDQLYRFLMKQGNPKDVVKILRLYLNCGDEILKHLDYVRTYDDLEACMMKPAQKTASVPSTIQIVKPNLKQYDSLLKGGENA